MKNLISVIIFSISSMFASSHALGEPVFFCKSDELLNCLHLEKKQCVQASDKSMELCLSHYDASSKSYEEMKSIISEVASCSFNQFLLITSVTKNELEACDSYFITAFNEFKKKFNAPTGSAAQ